MSDYIFTIPPKRSFQLEVEIESVKRGTPAPFIIPDWMIEEDEAQRQAMYALLIAARAGIVVHCGVSYALTWDEGVNT